MGILPVKRSTETIDNTNKNATLIIDEIRNVDIWDILGYVCLSLLSFEIALMMS